MTVHRGRLAMVLLRLLSAGALAGCTPGWNPIPRPAPAVLSPSETLQVWRRGESLKLQQVTIGADSVWGRVVDHWPRGDNCRVAIAQTEIDSFRVKATDSNNAFGGGMLIGLLAGGFIMLELLIAGSGT